MEREQEATIAVLEQMRDNPNSNLRDLATEVDLLSRKIDPILRRVEEA